MRGAGGHVAAAVMAAEGGRELPAPLRARRDPARPRAATGPRSAPPGLRAPRRGCGPR